MDTEQTPYAARLDIDYPEELNRLTTFFRLILVIPIAIILAIISASADSTYVVVSDAGVDRSVDFFYAPNAKRRWQGAFIR